MPVNSLLLLMGLHLSAPAEMPLDTPVSIPTVISVDEGQMLTKKDSAYTEEVDTILFVARELLDTRYRSRGTTDQGFDCSGFTQYCFKTLNINLPHSSAAQAKTGKPVKKAQAKPGDLIFFKGSNANNRVVGHVGIIVSVEANEIIFIHSAVKGGVRYDSTNTPYYKRRYVCIRRVLE